MFLLMMGCVGGGEPTDSGAQCGSTEGFVYGHLFDESAAFSTGTIEAWQDGELVTFVETDSQGAYELNLEGGFEYVLTAWNDEGCYAPDTTLTLLECTEHEIDIRFEGCDVADKPNLYLYPESPTEMTVELGLARHQRVVDSVPDYGDGWSGVALPDGRWEQDGQVHDFLFYEVSVTRPQSESLQTERGWCAADLAEITELVRAHGFTERETQDFWDGWVEDLPPADGYVVYPQRRVRRMAELTLTPRLPVERLWLVVEPASTCSMPPTAIAPLRREGAHGVEWGVILRGF
ncbi:MAG: hypothetical protein GY913_34740 [Proteobacteria bacterium]|nr:hypothetical protein [Pseudomonadota bacterium]MCP4922087.1 hypothetical protein [Pseudomonadota bacterium]